MVNGIRKFLCTFVNGLNDKKGRESIWSDFKGLNSPDLPWIILGDLSHYENG